MRPVSLICVAVLALAPCAAEAQQKIRVVGVLSLSSSPTLRDKVFQSKLRELGWVEGRNLKLEYRWGAGQVKRLPALAEDLVRSKVEIIVAQATPAVQAAKDATRAIPIVSLSADPVGNGFVASLSRPGGNITGVSMMMPDLEGKHLELLREMSPKLARVAYLGYKNDPAHRLFVKHAEAAGQRLAIKVQPVIVERAEDLDEAFGAMRRGRAEALIVQPLFVNTMGLGPRIIELASRERLPSISSADIFADIGGVIHYGPDPTATYERIAFYVDRVLKGASPANLPLEQPQKFTLVINLKTAKQLGLRTPASLLSRADKLVD